MLSLRKIKITKEYIDFINYCFGKDFLENLKVQHDNCGSEKGMYLYSDFERAFELFKDPNWVFAYNCSDCSFPKFRNIKKDEVHACINCGD